MRVSNDIMQIKPTTLKHKFPVFVESFIGVCKNKPIETNK